MKYFLALSDSYDYFNKNGIIPGELLTVKERNSNVRYIGPEHFREIEISSRKTFTTFGARFLKSDFWHEIPDYSNIHYSSK